MRLKSNLFAFSTVFAHRKWEDKPSDKNEIETRDENDEKIVASRSFEVISGSKRRKVDFSRSISRFTDSLKHYLLIRDIPGLVIGVSVNGRMVWARGFGYSNLEVRSPCVADSVMRIGSINKPIIAAIVAKFLEEEALDLGAEIQEYLPDFPVKTWEERYVEIKLRHLLSNTSGIRHYDKKDNVWNTLVKPVAPLQPPNKGEQF